MSSTELSSETESSLEELNHRVQRLERRLARETAARSEAERIAEDGMRKLYAANVDLDQRIMERTAELDAALYEAEAASRVKTDLLNGLSHEMRTPMNGVLGSLELLEDFVDDPSGQELLDTASTSAVRMNRLVVRLLKAIALESADFTGQLSPIRVQDLLEVIGGYWSARALKAGKLLIVKDDTEGGAEIEVYGDYLRDACDELIRNAIDHGVAGSISVRAHQATEDGERRIHIEVSDNGPGIAAEELVMLRQPLFARDSAGWPANGGLGLGLGLVDRLCEATGATWDIDSTPAGTTAVISLPTIS